jgi:hypothetical protein
MLKHFIKNTDLITAKPETTVENNFQYIFFNKIDFYQMKKVKKRK